MLNPQQLLRNEMRKKIMKTFAQNVELSFVPEIVHKVMTDVVAKIEVTQEEMGRLLELVDEYKNKIPVIKVVLTDPKGESITFKNFQLFLGDREL